MNISPERKNEQEAQPFKCKAEADCVNSGTLASFSPISLAEMDGIKLMNRVDRKYLTDRERLTEILKDAAAQGYRVFENCGERLHGYDSVYFDTPGLRMFTEHRRGKTIRQKVRTRIYKDSGQCFLEVKRKNNHGRTKKKRTEAPSDCFEDFRSNGKLGLWLNGHSDYRVEDIGPSLETSFNRITLVNKGLSERLTIDCNVRFRNLRTGTSGGLGKAVIIELKQDGRLHSEMQDILLRHRVKPVRVSKYCIGIVSTAPSVHPGRFKTKLRLIEKINRTATPAKTVL